MLLTKDKKHQLVSEMTGNLSEAKTTVLINFKGLRVKEIQDFKKKLKKQGIGFQIVKNSLLKIAIKNAKLEAQNEIFDQPIAAIWGKDDEVIPAKITAQFKKTLEKLTIVGGFVNGQFADENMIKKLAALPSRPELYAKLVGSLNAPMYRLVNALQGNLRSLVYILDQYTQLKAKTK
jgi:large subunit ribosomal protein L10